MKAPSGWLRQEIPALPPGRVGKAKTESKQRRADAVIDSCLRCGRSLGLVEDVLEGNPVLVPGRGELCPECYRSLTPEEYRHYFAR
jgi:hypothetical protein